LDFEVHQAKIEASIMNALLLRPVLPPVVCRDFLLENGAWIIGRSQDCDFVVNDLRVSRRHAKVVVAKGRVRVSDLGSQNGTWLDEERIRKSAPMAAGQELRLGEVIFAVMPWNPPEREKGEFEVETPPCESDEREGCPRALSEAEHRVFAELLKGSSEKEVAAKLHLSQRTVHNHVTAIYQYFGIHSRAELLSPLAKVAPSGPRKS
jgi:pSer/pThr/pTyr-binding forkhead associated (FHA) protein